MGACERGHGTVFSFFHSPLNTSMSELRRLHQTRGVEYERGSAEDEDNSEGEGELEEDEDDDTFFECNECKAEIQVTRFHCFQCGEGEDEGYDLCRYKSFL